MICGAIDHNTTAFKLLEVLDLSDNPLGDAGAQKLASYLGKRSDSARPLSLFVGNSNVDGGTLLGALNKHNVALRVLDMSGVTGARLALDALMSVLKNKHCAASLAVRSSVSKKSSSVRAHTIELTMASAHSNAPSSSVAQFSRQYCVMRSPTTVCSCTQRPSSTSFGCGRCASPSALSNVSATRFTSASTLGRACSICTRLARSERSASGASGR